MATKKAMTKATAKKAAPAKKTARARDPPHSPPAARAPLPASEIKRLRKLGDSDRSVAARIAATMRKLGKKITIPGITADSLRAPVVLAEAIVPEEAVAHRAYERLVAARLIADDKTAVLLQHFRIHLRSLVIEHPELADEFAFVSEYYARRSAPRASKAAKNAKASTPSK
ncbi:MAG: hypothetical protein ACHREM_02765 [Polyangiales bacterium]